MERRLSTFFAIGLVSIAAFGSTVAVPEAQAQTEPAKSEPAKPDPAKTDAAKPDPAKPAGPDAAKPDAASAKPVPAAGGGTSAVVVDLSAIESVIGKSVKSSTGEDLGRIVDLLVTTSGQVRAAVIDFGGFLGVGSRKVAVDWKALDFSTFTKDGTVRLALTRNQVRVSPEYKSGDPVVILQAGKPEDAKPEPSKSDDKKPAGQDPKAQLSPSAPSGEVSPPKADERK